MILDPLDIPDELLEAQEQGRLCELARLKYIKAIELKGEILSLFIQD